VTRLPRSAREIPFVDKGLVQFPDYEMLRSLLPKIRTHGRDLGTGNCQVHDVWEYDEVRRFLAGFKARPWAAYVSELRGGEFMDPHRDRRTTVKLHVPIRAENCTLSYHDDAPGFPIFARYRYRPRVPVLMRTDILHSVRNESKTPKYSLILAWEGLDLPAAARMLAKR
jgi:hypothetical protein